MIRRIFTTVLVAAAASAPAAAAPIRGQTLMPGVVFARQLDFTAHGPVVLNIVSAPRPTGLYSIHAALSNGLIPGREPLTQMEGDVSASTTVVGINGDFYNTRWGTPSGVVLRGGLLQKLEVELIAVGGAFGFANNPIGSGKNAGGRRAQPCFIPGEAVVFGQHPEDPTVMLVIAAGFIAAGPVEHALLR